MTREDGSYRRQGPVDIIIPVRLLYYNYNNNRMVVKVNANVKLQSLEQSTKKREKKDSKQQWKPRSGRTAVKWITINKQGRLDDSS